MSATPQYANQTVYVSFSAEINANTTESLISVMATLVNQRAKAVHLLLSTPGGNVMNGLNLYNVLLGLPFELYNPQRRQCRFDRECDIPGRLSKVCHSPLNFYVPRCRSRRFRRRSFRGEECSRDFRRYTEQSKKDWRDHHAAYQNHGQRRRSFLSRSSNKGRGICH